MMTDNQATDSAMLQLRLAAERFGFPAKDAPGERVIPLCDCRAIVTPITGAIAAVADVLHVSDHTMSTIYRSTEEPAGDVFVTLVDLGSDQAEVMMRISSSRRIASQTWHVEMRTSSWDPYAAAKKIERAN